MYHVFAGAQYYPSSGLGDYIDSYATLEEARAAAMESRSWVDWWAIVVTTPEGKLSSIDSGYYE